MRKDVCSDCGHVRWPRRCWITLLERPSMDDPPPWKWIAIYCRPCARLRGMLPGRGTRVVLPGEHPEWRPEAIPARINPTAVRERFMAYRMGWKDRAVGRARRRDDFAHRPDLLEEYDRGEKDGAEASGAAAHAAAERLGYDLELAIIDR